MKLSEVLADQAVVLPMAALDKWAVIELLVDRLVASGQVDNLLRARVHEALVERERSASTGMENGIAIPHTHTVEEIDTTAIALGISPDGLEFNSIDGRPTHLVILLVNPANGTKAHIRMLAEIARLVSSAELRAALIGAPSAADVLDVIRAAEVATA